MDPKLQDTLNAMTGGETEAPTDAELTSTPEVVAPDVPADSSTAEDATSDSSPEKDVPSESSPEEPDDPRARLLAIVKKAVEPEPKPEVAAPSTAKESETAKDESKTPAEKADATKPSEEDDDTPDEQLPFGKHPRFRKLTRRVKELEEPARQYVQVQQFMRDHEITPELAADTFQLAALYTKAQNGDAQAAKNLLEMLNPILTSTQELLGQRVPSDLQTQVDEGALTEASAKELTKLRRERDIAIRRSEESQSTSERMKAADARNRSVQEIMTAAAEWESDARTRDTDYGLKSQAINDRFVALIQLNGFPKDKAAAVAAAKQAYADVSARPEFKRAAKPPTSVKPPDASGVKSNSTTRAPKTALEAAQLALRSATSS